MKLCIFDNDTLAPAMQVRYGSYGRMFCRLFEQLGVADVHDLFRTELGEYPKSYEGYDAVLLTGSRADSFSDAPWVQRLRQEVGHLWPARPSSWACALATSSSACAWVRPWAVRRKAGAQAARLTNGRGWAR